MHLERNRIRYLKVLGPPAVIEGDVVSSVRIVVTMVLGSLLLAACGSGESDGSTSPGESKPVELRFASYIGEAAPQSQSVEWWAREVSSRSHGTIKVKSFYNESLLKGTEILPGVAQGRADLGYMANAYFPAELPLTSVVEVPFTNSNAVAQSQALMDLYENDATYAKEWEQQGVHVLYFPVLGGNVLGTREHVTSLADLKGKSIRGLGLVNEALVGVGANAVALTAAEIYEAVQRKVVDGFSGFAFEVIPALKLQEVASNITDTGLGEYAASVIVMDLEVYKGLSQEQRAVVDEVSREAFDQSVALLVKVEDTTCKAIKAAGGSITRLNDADIAKWRDAIGSKLVDKWSSERGSRRFYEAYVALVKKYASESDYVPGVERCASGQ